MPFIDRSTLTYPATNAFPVRKWLDNRNPVSGVNGDYKNFQIFDLWINQANQTAYIMVDKTANSGTWLTMAISATGILSITGNSGGSVGADGAGNINLTGGTNVTVAGNPGTNSLSITLGGAIASSYPTDAGTAIPAGGVLNVLGAGGTNTSAAGNTITITSGPTVSTQFDTDAGSAVPALNILRVLGGTGISTSGAGNTVTITAAATVPLTFTTDAGVATPALNNLNVLGAGSATTSGAGSTITINSTGGGLSWNLVSVVGPTAMSVNMGYVANVASPSACQLLLPLTAAFGSVIMIVGIGTGGFQITQNAGQTIHFLGTDTTTGATGTLTSTNTNSTIAMVCTTANTDWTVYSSHSGGDFILA